MRFYCDVIIEFQDFIYLIALNRYYIKIEKLFKSLLN